MGLMKLPKLNATFEPTKEELPKGFDFASGIHQACDSIKELEYGFEHGKKRGETTHIPELDKHLTWRPGFLYCNTGYPAHGKSEGTRYLCLLKAFFEGKKWGFYVPEDFPQTVFFDSLAHTLVGKSTDPKYKHNQMTLKEYREALAFLHEHMFFVYYKGQSHTPEFLRQVTAYLHAKHGIYGMVKDPWNKLSHKKGKLRDDEYLEMQLPLEQQQARELDIVQIINVHPVRIHREAGKPWPVPDQTHIAGGQMWDNMCDFIGAWHRPLYYKDKTSTITEFHTHKMKYQQLMGIPGSVEFEFNRHEARYYLDEKCPLKPVIVGNNPDPKPSTWITEKSYGIGNLPESQEFKIIEPTF